MAVLMRPCWLILALTLTLSCGRSTPPISTETPRVLISRMSPTTVHASCSEDGPWCLDDAARGSVSTTAAAPSRLKALTWALAKDPAERTLERFASELEERARSGGQAEDWLALGAVRFALALAQDSGHQLIVALENTERGLEKEPRAPWGLFNRALVLSELGLCRVAVEAWQRSIQAEQNPSAFDQNTFRKEKAKTARSRGWNV